MRSMLNADVLTFQEYVSGEPVIVRILSPVELIASKIVSFQSRRGKPKSGTDRRDLAVLLLKFPELKTGDGEVGEILLKRGVNNEVLDAWREIVAQDLRVEDDDEDLNF